MPYLMPEFDSHLEFALFKRENLGYNSDIG